MRSTRHSQNWADSVLPIIARVIRAFAPPPTLTVSQWADQHRRLSPESSAEHGQWVTARAEYQRGMMDAISDPRVEVVVLKTSSQVGKTEILNNALGYYIVQDPSPILIVQPTIEIGEAWSKDRLAPMLRDTPALHGKVKDYRVKDSANTIMHKTFPGGHLTIAGSNSPASLRARPIRVVKCDDIDAFKPTVEGDAVDLARKRTTTFWNRKIILASTPTIKGQSRIEKAFDESDQRYFYVPCPCCATFDRLYWANVKWEKDDPTEVWYQCEACGAKLTDQDRLRMIKAGEWRATKPFTGTAGFFIFELYSPWVPMRTMVANFLSAKKHPETLRVWVNTALGETWTEDETAVEGSELFRRREPYPAQVPDGVLVITAAVDVQDDRIEAEAIGWGLEEESWSLERRIFYGSPQQKAVWEDLDRWRMEPLTHASGIAMKITIMVVDTGAHSKAAYAYVKPRQGQRVYATKGSSQHGSPLVSRPSKANLGRVNLFSVGTEAAKDTIFARLKLTEFGPGYMHYPEMAAYDEEYFAQLTAESRVPKYERGVLVGFVYKKNRTRNETLDLWAGNVVAMAILNPNLRSLAQRVEAQKAARVTVPVAAEERPKEQPEPIKQPWQPRTPRGGNWTTGWRR